MLDGVAADRWFASLDIPADTRGEVQETVAKWLTTAIASDAEVGEVHLGCESVPPHTCILFFRTNVYIRLREIKRLRLSVIAGLLANLATSSPSTAVAVSTAVALWDNVTRLTDAEVEVIHVMQRLSDGHVYETWLSTEDVVKRLPPDGPIEDRLALLASLKSKNVLEEAASLWRVIK